MTDPIVAYVPRPPADAGLQVGDCIIINECERPSGEMIGVVTGRLPDGTYEVQYLNADPRFSPYNKPPMRSRLDNATKIETYGVKLLGFDGVYWCVRVGPSSATYSDGKPRDWQEHDQVRFQSRPELAALVWPKNQGT